MSLWLIGHGDARDHATFAAIRRHSHDVRMAMTGGNALLAAQPEVERVAGVEAAIAKVIDDQPDACIVMRPEFLFDGVADVLAAHGCPVFGPGIEAARLERSKLFCKGLLKKWGVATPEWFASPSADLLEAHLRTTWSDEQRWVVKSDLYMSDAALRTAVPESLAAAIAAVRRLAAVPVIRRGSDILLERRRHGPELSLHLLMDGRRAWVLPPVSDYKTLFDDDRGPNTHGMGAVAGAPLTEDEQRALEDRVLDPLLSGLAAKCLIYRGVLYIGLIWTDAGPTVLELNVRPGNPEWVALLARLRQPLGDVLHACANGRLEGDIEWAEDQVAGALFLTVPGYPTELRFDDTPVNGLSMSAEGVEILGEGVRPSSTGAGHDGRLVAGEGRSLCLATQARSIDEMRARLYAAAAGVVCPVFHYRRDVGLGRRLIRDSRPRPVHPERALQ